MHLRVLAVLVLWSACSGESTTQAGAADTASPSVDVPAAADTGDSSSCQIGGASIAAGATNPADACQVCDLATPTQWSTRSDGSACGNGQFCSTGTCEAGCWIDGALVAPGLDGCRECDPTRNATAWSPASDGASCGAGKACSAGECVTACVIGGAVVPDGAASADDPCAFCDAALDSASWSRRADGFACDEGRICSAAECKPACFFEGAVVQPGPVASNPCQVCDPSVSSIASVPAANGTSCGDGKVCQGAVCLPGCFIDGSYTVSGTSKPQNACLTCVPEATTATWTASVDGTSCSPLGVCTSGACGDGCFIDGVHLAPYTVNPLNPCQICDNAASTGAWTPVADGETCGGSQVCVSGNCVTGCWIDGALVGTGAVDPSNPCRLCDTSKSVTAYSPRPAATSCGVNLYCDADATCRSGCAIAGVFYGAGDRNPSNDCQQCAPASGSFNFSTLPNGSECTNGTCVSAACAASPFVGTIAPSCGSNLGGDVITISGQSFAPGATVSVAGVPSPTVVVSSTQSLAVTLPSVPGVTGLVPVSVSNAFGSASVKESSFTLFEGVAFRAAVNAPTANQVGAMSAGDVDDDGKDDLIYVVGSGLVVQRMGTIGATFGATDTLAGCTGAGSSAVVDVTSDGVGDIVVACGSSIQVFKGNVGAAPTSLKTMSVSGIVSRLVVGNFDLDGKADLAFATHTGTTINVYRGNGDATFTAATPINMGSIIEALTVGDVTGDGRDDVGVAIYTTNTIKIAVASGNAVFGSPSTTIVTTPGSIHFGRIDEDELADVVVSSSDATVSASYYLSTGNGALGGRISLTGGGLIGAAIGDFNEDGLSDVLVNGGGGIRVFPGNGDGTYTCVIQLLTDPEPYYLTVADFDGNGRLDVVGRNPNHNRLMYVMQNGP